MKSFSISTIGLFVEVLFDVDFLKVEVVEVVFIVVFVVVVVVVVDFLVIGFSVVVVLGLLELVVTRVVGDGKVVEVLCVVCSGFSVVCFSITPVFTVNSSGDSVDISAGISLSFSAPLI